MHCAPAVAVAAAVKEYDDVVLAGGRGVLEPQTCKLFSHPVIKHSSLSYTWSGERLVSCCNTSELDCMEQISRLLERFLDLIGRLAW